MGGAPRCSSFPGLRKQVLPPVPAKGYYAWERDEGLDVKKLTTAMLVLLMLVLLMLALFCGGCGGSASVAGENAGSGSGSGSGADGPRAKVVDQAGRELALYGVPQKIVSLSPANTEFACALGLEERLVGVTDYCNYPPQVEDKPKVGGFSDPNVEQIVAMEPELVLAGDMHPDVTEKLEDMGIAALVLAPENLDDIYISLELLAEVTDSGEAFAELRAKTDERIKAVQDALASLDEEGRVRVYFEIYPDPLMSVGSRSIIHEIISLAGGVNIFADVNETYPTVSSEAVVNRDPQVILFPNFHGSEELLSGLLQARPGWGKISAIVDGRVHGVDNDAFSRPGPRIIDAVEEAAMFFYPALFE